MSAATIVIADDHPIIRRGLRALLESEPDLRVVGEADNGLDAVHLVESLKPDVLITDVMMPGLSGMEVTRQSRERAPGTRVLVYSMYNNEAYVLEALKNGASGFVLKDSAATETLQAIREVAGGRRYLSASLSERAIEAYVGRAAAQPADMYDTLTTREREVLQLAAEGHRNSEIADRLSISPRTAETHRAHLLHKLSLHTQTDLIRFAIRRGILLVDG